MVVVSTNEEKNICIVEPLEALSESDFVKISSSVDQQIEREGKLEGLIIKTRNFPGWEKLSAVIEHFRFVKNHHRVIEKVALVTDAAVADLIPLFVGHFVKAEIKHFPFDEYSHAVQWLEEA